MCKTPRELKREKEFQDAVSCGKKVGKYRTEKRLLDIFKSIGKPRNSVEEIKDEFDRKPQKGQTYWYYVGPNDGKTRAFCKKLLELDKVFSERELGKISSFLGYDILEANASGSAFGPGAYNCRHRFVKFRGREIATSPPTTKQINDLIRSGIKV